MAGLTEIIEQRVTHTRGFIDDIAIEVQVANMQLEPTPVLSEQSPQLPIQRISQIHQWVREQTRLNEIVDSEYGYESSSSSEEELFDRESNYDSYTEYSESFIANDMADLPDLMDVSDSSVNSDQDYMSLIPETEEEMQSSSGESMASDGLIMEGPIDYETYCFMREWLGGMSEVGECLVAMHNASPPIQRALKARVSSRTIPRPPRTTAENRCLTLLVEINGLKAYTLFDSGSTGEALSPHFTVTAGLKVHALEKGVNIQLGTVGSQSKINFGVHAAVVVGNIKTQHYFDVFNIDKYDAIIGTLFMCQYGLLPDLKNDVLRFDNSKLCIPALTLEEDHIEQAQRSASRVPAPAEEN